ncbi:MAG: HAD-IC family P-type ATPase [Gemmatales bacterium]|nr:HAD-IC family P-type ATPase [Gemmatales bacterium]
MERSRTWPVIEGNEAWHAWPADKALDVLASHAEGLSQEEAAQRLRHYGPNELPRKPPPPLWQIFLRQFKSPLIYLLGIAAGISILTGHPTDAAFIGVVLLINAIIGTTQEWKAEESAHALQRLLRIRATVLRDGEATEVPGEDLVPGDVIWLESGNRVPADARLLWAQGLEVDESLLTGESVPVSKDADWLGRPDTVLADRHNMVFAGTLVARGRARAVVVATGSRTVVGQLALDVQQAPEGLPPLLQRMERFAWSIGLVVLVSCAIVGVLAYLIRGYTTGEVFLFAVALAVSAIPEGLPAALTVALAVATHRMARRGVIVRRLAAVEGLGSCTLIASDKTGTLTCNELTVKKVRLPDGSMFEVTGQGYTPVGEVVSGGRRILAGEHPALDRLARAAVLCSEADLHQRDQHWVWRGDPTEVALLAFGHKLGWHRESALEKFPLVGMIPFEPELRYSASFHLWRRASATTEMTGTVETELDAATEEWLVVVKGAPERVLFMCRDLDESRRTALIQSAEQLAAQGYRVLALAEGIVAADGAGVPPALESDHALNFLGYVGMIDPLRPGAKEAVAECHRAGITVCMITGDHPTTALAIARELGLAERPEQVVTGQQLEKVPAEQLPRLVQTARVFARVTPKQKLLIVEAAKAAGHIVAVTGDGANDAPALRAANIGVAMGRSGTDVAREAAELVITDDNFATIVAGVEEGRVAYDNVRKVIYLLISKGAAEVILVLLAVAAGLPLPLLPVQLLWLNAVTNGIQDVALAFEPNEGGVLRRKPRPPKEPILNRLMIERTVIAAIVMALIGFLAFRWMLELGWSEKSARNGLLMLAVLFENIHIGNCRSETKSAFVLSPLRSPILLIGTITAFLVHIFALFFPPLQAVLQTEPIKLQVFAIFVLCALTIVPVMELHKLSWRWRYPEEAV